MKYLSEETIQYMDQIWGFGHSGACYDMDMFWGCAVFDVYNLIETYPNEAIPIYGDACHWDNPDTVIME